MIGTRTTDLVGQRFGLWIVVMRAPNGPRKEVRWLCRCECGTERSVLAFSLRNGDSLTCGGTEHRAIERPVGELISYYPETGEFRWLVARDNNRLLAGARAGGASPDGYWRIRVGRKDYAAHRLAWFLMTGEWPTLHVDHINCDRSDNRWTNLRLATNVQNAANQRVRPKNKTGFKGVTEVRGRYRATIFVRGETIDLGTFDTPQEASDAYARKATELHGEFARAS